MIKFLIENGSEINISDGTLFTNGNPLILTV